MSEKLDHALDTLFYPRHIAFVGASPKKGKRWSSGNAFMSGAFNQGFQGDIYPVHPKAKNILGYQVYAGIRDIPGAIDLAIFTIPTRAALQVMEDCVAKGVKFVHLLTAGFSETGHSEQSEIEDRIVAIAQEGGVRIIGPNCMGIYCPEGGIAWNDQFPTKSGNVGFFSQSGQLASHFILQGPKRDIYFNKVVSFGNARGVSAYEFLEYFAQDSRIDIIGAYLEGLRDGRSFFESAKRITPKKPVVVWKGGQTEGGSRATFSHTAAIAGSQKIWEAMCRQAGIISVHSMQEALSTFAALRMTSLPKGLNVAILGGAGGGSVTMTDMAEKEGLKVPRLSEKSIQSLNTFIPLQGNSVKNPLDASFEKEDHFSRLARILRDDPNIDALIYNLYFPWFFKELGRSGLIKYLQKVIKGKEEMQKPLLVALEPEGDIALDVFSQEVAEWFHEKHIPTCSSFEIAARVLHNLYTYQNHLAKVNEGANRSQPD
ncbi:MAG: CoA-binding protein [Deltaproteobacteria bacterium]|nr:CoA-binding protein [Deltaproteobacteria bacterium]